MYNEVSRAIVFAIRKHGAVVNPDGTIGQKRKYSGDPYVVHVVRVAQNLVDIAPNVSVAAQCAAILHDTVEDTKTTSEEIQLHFGQTVADMVDFLTDPPSSFGNRKARKAEVRRKLAGAPKEVQLVKCADILDNAQDIGANDADFYVTYRREVNELLNVFDKVDHEIIEKIRKVVNRE